MSTLVMAMSRPVRGLRAPGDDILRAVLALAQPRRRAAMFRLPALSTTPVTNISASSESRPEPQMPFGFSPSRPMTR